MKAKLVSLMLGLVAFGHAAHAQNTGYKMNVKMTDGSFFSVPADDVSEVYFTTTEEKQFTDTYYTVSGRAEKGPFKSGTTITMQPLDLTANALGTAQTTMTFDDCGNYAFRNTLFKYPYVQVSANGLFFNEVDDYNTRDTQISLQGYADLQNGSKVNVNVVTHLISERVINLVIGGLNFDAALSQAQGELLSAFGLQRLNDKSFTQVSITDGDDYAAGLLAISMPLLYSRKGSELISWMTRLRYDFADDGKFTEQNKEQYKKDRNNLSLSYNVQRLIEKYNGYGVTISVKDLKYFYDWDDDGVAGNEIYDPSQPATCDVTSISAPMEGGTYTVNVSCNVPLYTSPLNKGNAGPTSESTVYYEPFVLSDMSLTTSYDNGVLSITVNPAQYRIISDRNVILYDAVGNAVVSVSISQEGNPNGTFLTNEGVSYVTAVCMQLAQSHVKYKIADAKYTGIFPSEDFKAPLAPYDYNVRDLFSFPYQVINRNTQLLRMASETGVDALNPMCYVINALMYYELITMFGDVPYITTQQDTYSIPRTSASEILNGLIANLTSVMDKLSDVKAGYISDADGIAMPPKDLARVILADIYMYQGKYAEAKALLSEIVNANRYSLVSSVNNLEIDCQEIIWSQPSFGQTRARANRATIVLNDNCIVKTYADVLLSLAECESKLGNDTKANEYLNQVKSAKDIETTSTDVLQAISEVRSKIQIDFGGYFAFLKRTGLAKSTLGLEEYQLLFPIPQSELDMNPAMTQNPGYNGSVTR
ncbi:MAG: RagB/SusD family nutrient uptake outer membrane protein [Prevotella sp.]|nr:RagB/SusD family nutrient uptake outer membrane protein [Prevotella sp.]